MDVFFKHRLIAMFSLRFLPLIFLLFTIPSLFAQTTTPFHRGVNLTGWFQANSARQIQFTLYTKQDFEQIKSLGCDVIRLPINLHYMTNGAPNYTLDPLFLGFLDEVVNWAEALDLHLILDNHTFDPAVDTDPNIGIVLNKVWLQMAQHFKDRSNLIYYEILNEPHGISDSLWNAIQQSVVTTIRTVDDKHTIIVGGAEWNSYNSLALMPAYSDSNLIYTFHFYDPFLFTHQGASWTQPSLEPLSGIPFPFNASNMPPLPPSLEGTWLDGAYNNYANEGTVAHLQQLLDVAIQFREARQVPVFCGEMGVLMDNSNPDDRVFWYRTVSQYLNEHNIAWTVWDYHGTFGLFEPGSDGFFDHDLNVPLLEALGFNVPPQSPFVLKPDSVGFFIYTDYVAPKMFDASYSDGVIDFYSKDLPNNGNYCIRWSGASQYNVLAFDFRPDKDLTYLRAQSYALDLLVRGDTPGTSFDLRFMDTDTDDPNDRPWRAVVTIDDSRVTWDGRWHHLHIPLSSFTESGAWEDGTWYDPQGLFDWTAIDRFEIVAEQGGLQGANLWFDNIQVTNLDTALVYETGVFSSTQEPLEKMGIVVAPNPAGDFIVLKSAAHLPVQWQLMDPLGRVVKRGSFTQVGMVDVSTLPSGWYGLHWKIGKWSGTEKMVKY